MNADGPILLMPLKLWLRKTFLSYAERQLAQRQALDELAKADVATTAHALHRDANTGLRIAMLDAEPDDARDVTAIMDVLNEIHNIVGRALMSLDVTDGCEAWVTFVDEWEVPRAAS